VLECTARTLESPYEEEGVKITGLIHAIAK
jgi:hypothetical protein